MVCIFFDNDALKNYYNAQTLTINDCFKITQFAQNKSPAGIACGRFIFGHLCGRKKIHLNSLKLTKKGALNVRQTAVSNRIKTKQAQQNTLFVQHFHYSRNGDLLTFKIRCFSGIQRSKWFNLEKEILP